MAAPKTQIISVVLLHHPPLGGFVLTNLPPSGCRIIATIPDVTVSSVRTKTFPRSLPVDLPFMSYWSGLVTQLFLAYITVEDRVSP